MDRRSRYNGILIIWLAVYFLIGWCVWSFQAGELLLIGYLAVSTILYAVAAFLFRCPACRMPVLLRPRRFLGFEIFSWSCCVPSTCRHCGERLSP
ncbi:MAG: hypothetical protein OEW15_14265 [Nitrospirota bacterium]|nr:hypothetical protein [Nitrospirota bacterium]